LRSRIAAFSTVAKRGRSGVEGDRRRLILKGGKQLRALSVAESLEK
jgi:hypothetical protein